MPKYRAKAARQYIQSSLSLSLFFSLSLSLFFKSLSVTCCEIPRRRQEEKNQEADICLYVRSSQLLQCKTACFKGYFSSGRHLTFFLFWVCSPLTLHFGGLPGKRQSLPCLTPNRFEVKALEKKLSPNTIYRRLPQ